ncbi:uroporphyrinogen decarboxylase [Salaquimonas pukyongi]|uniref:uroporphyrinogen decarboxylase n=1 Tax=Salaquimonas pukyongi TaxID=2712698 RepID=UPI00096BCFFB|nr:uroporphyrinogen decarboxylase [Salaquimonas pukyongi]
MIGVLDGQRYEIPPVWIMRQAGRYLPEYRKCRKKAGSFLDLCYTPEYAIEVTLQPIRRFGFDASILFSDILVIPDAMGRKVRFEEGRGPVLEPIGVEEIEGLVSGNREWGALEERLQPVLEAVGGIRAALPEETTLLGFCGAPWTVATYMIAGHSTSDQAPARLFAHRHEKAFEAMLNALADRSADYLVHQLQAGADAVQIFDSWAGVLDPGSFEEYCVRPVKRIVDSVRERIPKARIIAFPKGAGLNYEGYAAKTGATAIGLDWTVPLDFAQSLQKEVPVQGNLDPTLLVAGGRALDEGVDRVCNALSGGPHIFNLGHGITPDTPVAHVEQMLARIRG